MKQINVASGFTRDVNVVKGPAAKVPALPVDASDDLSRVKEEVRACEETIGSLKEMVKKLEADFLAVELQVLKIKANIVPAKVTSPDRVVPVLRGQPDDHWESCDSAWEYSPDALSDDDY